LTVLAIALLIACGGGGSPAAPKGWQPVPGASAAWATGTGANAQEYRYTRKRYDGTLQDLASAVTIDVLLHERGAKLQRSVPFAPCPGAAGLATFTLPSGMTRQEGFTVSNGQSIRTSYIRRTGAPVDPSVTEAMQSALCIRPA
jgi:hypothetical protein